MFPVFQALIITATDSTPSPELRPNNRQPIQGWVAQLITCPLQSNIPRHKHAHIRSIH